MINPVWMGGLVKEIYSEMVKIHLNGRLGVITLLQKYVHKEKRLEPGREVRFYFSYLQVVENPYDYDSAAMESITEFIPCLLGGRIIEVNDTAVRVEVIEGIGYVSVPRRWVFTDVVLEIGQTVEFYLSPVMVVGKK